MTNLESLSKSIPFHETQVSQVEPLVEPLVETPTRFAPKLRRGLKAEMIMSLSLFFLDYLGTWKVLTAFRLFCTISTENSSRNPTEDVRAPNLRVTGCIRRKVGEDNACSSSFTTYDGNHKRTEVNLALLSSS